MNLIYTTTACIIILGAAVIYGSMEQRRGEGGDTAGICGFQPCDYKEEHNIYRARWETPNLVEHTAENAVRIKTRMDFERQHVERLDGDIEEELQSPYILSPQRLVDRAFHMKSLMADDRDWWDPKEFESGIKYRGVVDLTRMLNKLIDEERDYLLGGLSRSISVPLEYSYALWDIRRDLDARNYLSWVEEDGVRLILHVKIPDCVLLRPCGATIGEHKE